MHHHHALALLLFSIVFAAFALFTLCTFAPKNHNPSNLSAAEMEDNALSSLSGLPIRRSLEFGPLDAPLIVRDGILLNERGYRGTLTVADEGHHLVKRSADVSQLIQRIQEPRNAKECSQCLRSVTDNCRQAQHVRLTDPSIRYWVPFEQPLQVLQDGKSLMDRILTLLTFWKRSSPVLPSPAGCSVLPEHDNLFSQDKEQPIFSKEYIEDASEERVKAPKHASWDEGALFLHVSTTDNVPQETPQDRLMVRTTNKSTVGNASGNHKRELIGKQDNSISQILPQDTLGKQSNVLDSAVKRSIEVSKDDSDLLAKRGTLADALPTSLNRADKKMVAIDFQKAERDAQRAGLAPGFIIETEYPTQQRKVVQHLNQKPGSRTVKLHFEGDRLVFDNPELSSYAPPIDVHSIMDNVLAKHDEQKQMGPIGGTPFQPDPLGPTTPNAPTPPIPIPTALLPPPMRSRFPRHELVKRGSDETPRIRRSFRFDRQAVA